MTPTDQAFFPDELEAEEPNPYRRRQKVIGIRRGGREAKSRWLKRVGFGAFLPIILFLGLRWAVHSVIASPAVNFQPVRDIKLAGNQVVSRDDVLNAIGFGDAPQSRPASILMLNLSALERRVESIPWVASAVVMRTFPHTLLVTISERTPIAYANLGGHIRLVDKDGVLLDPLRRVDPHFPVLYGLNLTGGAAAREAELEPYESFCAETKDVLLGSGWSVSEADLSDADDLRVLLVRGSTTILAHFGDKDFERRLSKFFKVAPEVLAGNSQIDSVDLRFGGQVVVDPDEKAAGRPQSGIRPAAAD